MVQTPIKLRALGATAPFSTRGADVSIERASMQNTRVLLACLLFTGNVVCVGTWIWAFTNYPITLHEPDPVIWCIEVIGFILIALADALVFVSYLKKVKHGV